MTSSARVLALLAPLVAACGLSERPDFLVGRQCNPALEAPCDPGQRCLPHRLDGERYGDHRCRDRASFEPRGGDEAPLAYCDPAAGLLCPGDLVCNADRIREDAGRRATVCKLPDDLFGPPLDALDGGA